MSVQSQIDRINQNVADTYTALAEIGADMPSEQNSGNMAGTARTVKAVMYAEQELTEDQKLQARENIGASGKVLQSVVIPDTLVWDGNTEGLQVFDMMENGAYTFYPVSDKVVTLDDLASGVIIETTIPADDISTEIFVNDFATMHTNVFASRTIANLLFVSKDNSTLYGNTIPKKGVYFLHSAEYGYVSRIKILGYTGFDAPVDVLKCKYKPVYTPEEIGAQPKGDYALRNELLSATNFSLGIASDGLIYLFVNGTPVGTGIPQGQSGDVFGYVDENNTIVLNGNLADGTYSVKYEMENGEVVNIGNMVLDTNVYYSITSNLTNCINSNSAAQIAEGESYTATIAAKSGYELKSLTVTMGGSPVSVSGGSISISNVTGNIVITAVAEEAAVTPSYTNLATPDATATGQTAWDSGGWCNNSYMAGSSYAYRAATDGKITTNTIAVANGDIIYVKGIKYNAGTFPQIAVFDSNKSYVKHGYASNMNVGGQGLIILTATENSDTWYFTNSGQGGADVGTRFIRIAGLPSGSINDIIITRNQPIS